MVLDTSVRRKLDRVLKEHRQSSKLHAHGLAPRHRLLLVGPPGSGKTMTAAARVRALCGSATESRSSTASFAIRFASPRSSPSVTQPGSSGTSTV